MKMITDIELKELPFGSKIKIISMENETWYGIVFGDKIGYEDGTVEELDTIKVCMHRNLCTVYVV